MSEPRAVRARRRTVLALASALLLGLAGAVVLVALFVAPGFVEGDPAYCARCHSEQAEHLPGHGSVACQSCHAAPQGRLRSAFAYLSTDTELPEHGGLVEGACASCHNEDDPVWQAVSRAPAHRQHVLAPPGLECTRCHGISLHGRPQPEAECLSCHRDVALVHPGDENLDCTRCHPFDRRSLMEPPAPPVVAADTAHRVTVDHVHGAADCRTCHNPHTETRLEDVRCTQCHRGAVAASVERMPPQHEDCRSCHDVHAPREAPAAACSRCHEQPRVEGAAARAVASHGRGPLREQPHGGRCETCHTPHSGGPWAADCRTCHDEVAAQLASLPRSGHESCTGCHEPHSAVPGDAACRACHGQRDAGRGVPARHRDCLECHGPHEAAPRFEVVCASCHRPVRAELAGGPRQHSDCASCHRAHGPPSAGSTEACARCHRQIGEAVRTATAAPHGRCATCHDAHEFRVGQALAACVRCHGFAAAPGASHRGRCTECHAAHGATPEGRLACSSCHAEVRTRVPAHGRCATCHQPHQGASSASCEACHGAQVRGVRAWPRAPHDACLSCHRPHDEGNVVSCASCHAAQSTVAHTGAHGQCGMCHPPHRAPATGAVGWWGRCGECHREQARGAASAPVVAHQRCAECHDRPGRRSPSCQSCHSAITGTALHARPEHRDCAGCHAVHGATSPGRADCLRCHQDRRNHFPDAPRCQACHPFTTR